MRCCARRACARRAAVARIESRLRLSIPRNAKPQAAGQRRPLVVQKMTTAQPTPPRSPLASRKQTFIAAGAMAAIALHLLLRFALHLDSEYLGIVFHELPLVLILVLGGGPPGGVGGHRRGVRRPEPRAEAGPGPGGD